MIKLQEKETKQETFDFVIGKLREQGQPSIAADSPASLPTCAYGEPGGIRCAAGHLLGDAVLVGENVEEFGRTVPLATANLSYLAKHGIIAHPKQYSLILDLQEAHDKPARRGDTGVEWAKECARQMQKVARDHVLSPATATAWLESLQ